MHRTIRFRLFAVLALNLALLIAVAAFAIAQMVGIGQEAHTIGTDTISSFALLDKLDNTILRYRALQLRFVVNRGAAQMADVEAEMQALEAQMGKDMQQYRP